MKQLRGKGGLYQCPVCKSEDIDVYEKDLTDYEYMIHKLKCYACGKEYKETWKAIEWEGT